MPLRPVSYADAHGDQTPFRLLGCLRCLLSRPRRRDPRPPTPSRRPETGESLWRTVHLLGPGPLGVPPSSLERLEGVPGSGQAGDRDRLAPPLVPPLLAPEVSWPPHETGRDPPPNPPDGPGEPNLGHSEDSRPEPTKLRSQSWATFLKNHAPDHRPDEPAELGNLVALPRLGGLHHRYSRRAA